MKKIIHIATDEKFINSAYWQFNEIFPEQNTFYLIVDDIRKPLKHVQLNDNYILIQNKLKNLKKIAESFSKNQIIIVHGLDYFNSFIINALSNRIKIVWILWGAEIYNNPGIVTQTSLFDKNTYSTFVIPSKDGKVKKFAKDSFRQLFYKLKNHTDKPSTLILKAIKRADYCGVLYREEYDFIREKTGANIKFLKFSYYPIELMVGDTEARITSSNILIGNSASETNNHLDAFLRLKKIPVKGTKIMVPLSYGNPSYGKGIIEKGREFFGDDFHPLIDFMPLHDYNKYLEQCGIVIMNHYRQQAVGNVLTMLYMGAKVYLDERNTLFHYLRRLGVKIFSISKDLNPKNPDCLELLTQLEQNHNRSILFKEINRNNLLDQLKLQLVSIL